MFWEGKGRSRNCAHSFHRPDRMGPAYHPTVKIIALQAGFDQLAFPEAFTKKPMPFSASPSSTIRYAQVFRVLWVPDHGSLGSGLDGFRVRPEAIGSRRGRAVPRHARFRSEVRRSEVGLQGGPVARPFHFVDPQGLGMLFHVLMSSH